MDKSPARIADVANGGDSKLATAVRSVDLKSELATDELEDLPPPATDDVTTKRLLIFTRGGPLIVDWRISIDGQSMQENGQAYLQRILKLADTNRDGKATWQEIHASSTFQSGRLGNTMYAADTDIKDLIRRYDLNRNSLLDIDEAARFLTGINAGQDLFRLSHDSASQLFGHSPLLDLLDSNQDGVLSRLECERAAATLGNQDPNGDEILFPADVSPLDINRMRKTRTAEKAQLLDQRGNWRNVVFALENRYARNYEYDDESFSLTPGLLAKLDQNADQSIDKTEAALLTQIAPHLIFKTSLGTAAGISGEPLVVEWLDPVLKNAAIDTTPDGSLLIELNHVTLIVSARDLAGAVDYGQQAAGILNALDSDQNGYLEPAETEASPLGTSIEFELADRDENEKLFPDEIADFLREQAPSSSNQLVASIGDIADPVFHAVDKNFDQRLTAREIQNAGLTIWHHDGNQDGLVAADEFPEVFTLSLTRGASRDFAARPQTASPTAVDTSQFPNWFLKMDRNGDLDISHREFLGNPTQFAALDTNQDGFISADEIDLAGEEPAPEKKAEETDE